MQPQPKVWVSRSGKVRIEVLGRRTVYVTCRGERVLCLSQREARVLARQLLRREQLLCTDCGGTEAPSFMCPQCAQQAREEAAYCAEQQQQGGA